MDDRPVAAIAAAELAGDVRSRHVEVREARIVERQRGRRLGALGDPST